MGFQYVWGCNIVGSRLRLVASIDVLTGTTIAIANQCGKFS